jgi:hypothetical protein
MSPEGILTYYELDNTKLAKDEINLKHSSVADIRFVYAGRWQEPKSSLRDKNTRPF